MKTKENQAIQRLLVWSAVTDLLLGAGKVAVGVFANSYALVADGIHSFSDLATDAMVWIFNRIGVRDPDPDHPYGYRRFETLGTFLLGGILIVLAALLIYQNLERLIIVSDFQIPSWPALFAAAVSIFAKEYLYRVTKRMGDKYRSNLLIANAWHHRSDSLSSIIVFFGVLGALAGIVWLEMVAAVGVALMIGQIGWSLVRKSVEELVDTAQSNSYVSDLEFNISEVEGVSGVHSIRTRRMGPDVLVDVHLQVDPMITVSEGHHIGEWVTKRLLENFNEINDVIVHIDAEDDELLESRIIRNPPPLRKQVREKLEDTWADHISFQDVERLDLHYLNGGITAELYLLRSKNYPDDLKQHLTRAANELPWLQDVQVWFR